jgi:hypothetical protein
MLAGAMPYVQRDHKGNIVGLYAAPQEPVDGIPRTGPEPLPDDHPEVVAFLQKLEALHGPRPKPPPMPTIEEMKRRTAEGERLKREHEEIKKAVDHFNAIFAGLEIALSALLYATLNIRKSQVAYAIYYSPTSFDARATLVDNALTQIISESDELKESELLSLWQCVHANIAPARRLRNALAHGSQITLSIRGKQHARFAPLAFDVIRLGRPMAKRQIPGLTANDISAGAKKAQVVRDQIDIANRIITDFWDGAPTWRQRLLALKASLTKPDSP